MDQKSKATQMKANDVYGTPSKPGGSYGGDMLQLTYPSTKAPKIGVGGAELQVTHMGGATKGKMIAK